MKSFLTVVPFIEPVEVHVSFMMPKWRWLSLQTGWQFARHNSLRINRHFVGIGKFSTNLSNLEIYAW